MTGTGRPIIAPPVAPERQVPVAPPPFPPALAAPVPVDRWHYGRLFLAAGLLAAAIGYAAVRWAAAPDGWFWAAVGEAGCLFAAGWTERAYRADLRAEAITRRAHADAFAAEMAEWQASLDAERAVLHQWSAHEHGGRKAAPAKVDDPQVTHREAAEQAQAAFRASVVNETVKAVVEQLTPLLTEQRARVLPSDPPPSEQPTAHLDPARDLLDAAYHHGPAWKLVERAARRESIANNQVCPLLMSNKQWRLAVATLGQAGVLVSDGPRQPWRLADDLPADDLPHLHMQALERLQAAGCVPSELPSDLDL